MQKSSNPALVVTTTQGNCTQEVQHLLATGRRMIDECFVETFGPGKTRLGGRPPVFIGAVLGDDVALIHDERDRSVFSDLLFTGETEDQKVIAAVKGWMSLEKRDGVFSLTDAMRAAFAHVRPGDVHACDGVVVACNEEGKPFLGIRDRDEWKHFTLNLG